jgi:hypothetical protein
LEQSMNVTLMAVLLLCKIAFDEFVILCIFNL